jgi:hypothetical protein
MQAAFVQGMAAESPNADLNAEVAGGILGCFPAELFDSTGQLRSLWSMRLSNTANDAQGMIDQLLVMDGPSTPPAKPKVSGRRRWFGVL